MRRVSGTIARRTFVLILVVALSAMMAVPAFANDEVDDINATGNTTVALGTQTVGTTVADQSVELVLRYGSGQHASVGQVVTVQTRNPGAASSGVSAQTWSFTVPAGWGSTVLSVSDTQLVNVHIQADGQSELKVDCTLGCERINENSATVLFNYTAQSPPTNAAPTVSASFGGTVDCRDEATLTVTFSDPDGSTSWSAVIDWDYDGTTFDEDQTVASILSGAEIGHTYNTPGTYTAAVKVTDNQGATSAIATDSITVNQTYAVDFLPPFDDSSPSGLIVNKMKNGRVVPVKVTLFDECALSYVTGSGSTPTIKITKTSASGGTGDPIEEYADAGASSAGTSSFRWSADGFWVYNLDSKALGLTVGNAYRTDVYVGTVKATVDNWGVLQPVK